MDRYELRRDIAGDIYRAAQHKPTTLTADGGELATVLAELAIRRCAEFFGVLGLDGMEVTR